MKVLITASECSPFAKVGGIGDVIEALPKALNKLGVDVTIAIPFYNGLNIEENKLSLLYKDIPIFFENQQQTFNVYKSFLPNSKIPILFIDSPKYFSTKGIYVERDASSGGSDIEASRFLFLSRASIRIAEIIKADIIHCNDWHTALIPFLIKKENKNIKTILTIHNLGYQGIYSNQTVNHFLGTNFSEQINSLKWGILKADLITTVSPNYAREIMTPKYGFGLENTLDQRKNDLSGILNGIDYQDFNPQKDRFINKNYSVKNLKDKEINKFYLQREYFKRIDPDLPIISIVTRLATQKGIDLILEILPQLMNQDIQFILLGRGAQDYENFFIAANKRFPNKFIGKIEFNEKLAHQIYAGADIFLMPSLYEPCGLGQEIAMRYGTVPIVRNTGGLRDTVFPVKIKNKKVKGTGFMFDQYHPQAFLDKIKEALDTYQKKNIWKQIMINGMEEDFSWKKSAQQYEKLYQKLLSDKKK